MMVGITLREDSMPRPKLTERITLRIPEELLSDLTAASIRRGISINEVALCCFENEMARLSTYHLDYYGQLRPALAHCLGVNVAQLSRKDANV